MESIQFYTIMSNTTSQYPTAVNSNTQSVSGINSSPQIEFTDSNLFRCNRRQRLDKLVKQKYTCLTHLLLRIPTLITVPPRFSTPTM